MMIKQMWLNHRVSHKDKILNQALNTNHNRILLRCIKTKKINKQVVNDVNQISILSNFRLRLIHPAIVIKLILSRDSNIRPTWFCCFPFYIAFSLSFFMYIFDAAHTSSIPL